MAMTAHQTSIQNFIKAPLGQAKTGVIKMQVDINNLTLEEIYKKMSIQNISKYLESDDEDTVRQGLGTLAAMAYITKRKDALYLLVGYYILEIKDLNDKESFFISLGYMCNYELMCIVLQDISQYKDFYRKKLFVDSIKRSLL